MKRLAKKIWYWLRCEDENGNPADDAFCPFRYSENIKKFPLEDRICDDDIIQISHKNDNGEYTTRYVTIRQLKEGLV